mmetsp:Transcript_40357/g.86666  ORF Transcript_40357/g.86666 Transcript_40357/m.86666 type:complete len:571 (-) Transcript_40357:252-1964(-)
MSVVPFYWTKASEDTFTDDLLARHYPCNTSMHEFELQLEGQRDIADLNRSLPDGAARLRFATHSEPRYGISDLQWIEMELRSAIEDMDATRAKGTTDRATFRDTARDIPAGSRDDKLDASLAAASTNMSAKNRVVLEANDATTEDLLKTGFPDQTFTDKKVRKEKCLELKEGHQRARAEQGRTIGAEVLKEIEGHYITVELCDEAHDLETNAWTFAGHGRWARKIRQKAYFISDGYVANMKALSRTLESQVIHEREAEKQAFADEADAKKKLAVAVAALQKFEDSKRKALYETEQRVLYEQQQARMKANHDIMTTHLAEVDRLADDILSNAQTFTSEANDDRRQVLKDVSEHHKESILKVYRGLGEAAGILEQSQSHHEVRQENEEKLKKAVEDLQAKEKPGDIEFQEFASDIKKHTDKIVEHIARLGEIKTLKERVEAVLKKTEALIEPNDDLRRQCDQEKEEQKDNTNVYFQAVLGPPVTELAQEPSAAAAAASSSTSEAIVATQMQAMDAKFSAMMAQWESRSQQRQAELEMQNQVQLEQNRDLAAKLEAMARENAALKANMANIQN